MRFCPRPEDLLAASFERSGPAVEHSRGCAACQAMLAQHEALERSLFQLTDPSPPLDLVSKVMAQVAAQPAPREVGLSLGILGFALLAGVGLLFTSDAALGQLGGMVASVLLGARSFLGGVLIGSRTLWATATLPLLVATALALAMSLFAVQRLATFELKR